MLILIVDVLVGGVVGVAVALEFCCYLLSRAGKKTAAGVGLLGVSHLTIFAIARALGPGTTEILYPIIACLPFLVLGHLPMR
jgi:hypothetical protein